MEILPRLPRERGRRRPGSAQAEARIGAARTRRLAASEGTDRPSGSAYGNSFRGTRDTAPVVSNGAPLIARTDVPDAHGWRVYRVAPNGAVIYDGWIEHDPDHPSWRSPSCGRPRRRAPVAALHRAVESQPGHASEKAITRWLAGQETERRSAPATPRSRAARRRWWRRALARKGARAWRASPGTATPRR